MALIVYGVHQFIIGVDEFLIKCPSCESDSWADVLVVSKYYQFYWIPIFPLHKEANIICKKCGLKRYGMSFDKYLISNFIEIKNDFRHPWYAYSGIAFFLAFILAIGFSLISNAK